jgi:hypothetical protein
MSTETPLAELLKRIVKDHGFLSVATLQDLAKIDRLRMVLVRCGNGRFLCPAQDVEHFMDIIRRDFDAHNNGCDYVRDVALQASDPAFRGNYRPHTIEGSYRPQQTPARKPAASTSPFPAIRGSSYDLSPSDADPGL